MVQRQGRVVAVTVPNVQRATVMPHIIERVLPKSTIYTDENRAAGIGRIAHAREYPAVRIAGKVVVM
jgi:transposase-like protein